MVDLVLLQPIDIQGLARIHTFTALREIEHQAFIVQILRSAPTQLAIHIGVFLLQLGKRTFKCIVALLSALAFIARVLVAGDFDKDIRRGLFCYADDFIYDSQRLVHTTTQGR